MEGLIFKHVKRGSDYRVDGLGTAQAADVIRDGDCVVVYKSCDGRIWVRKREEFLDGRFEEVTDGRKT